MDRIVLAYSGGLNTSAAISWLADRYRAEIITMTLDLGQGHALDDVRERARSIGARRAHVVDVREAFARDFVLRSLQAGALYDGRYPLASALARPVIAEHLVRIAALEEASAVAHGCGDEDIDHLRIEAAVGAFDATLPILAPARDWDMDHDAVVAYARERGTPVPPGGGRSSTANLWGRSIDAGPLDGDSPEPPEDRYLLTESPATTPNQAAYVDLDFECGVPVAINGVAMPLVELIASLETIAGTHGVGRLEFVGRRPLGRASREIVEAPAAVVLHTAHKALQRSVIPSDLERLVTDLGAKYAEIVDNGLWFTPMREASDALIAKVQEKVTGLVRLKLFKGQCHVVNSRSPFATAPAAERERTKALGAF